MIAPAYQLRQWLDAYCAERDLSPKTREFYRTGVNGLEAWTKRPLSLQEAADRLNGYIEHLADSGNRYTAKAHRAALIAILRSGSAEKFCVIPRKIRPVKVPEHRPRGLMPEEISRLLEHADPLQTAAIRLACDTGFRRGDLFSVTWAAVFRGDDGYRISKSPNKTGRLETRRLRVETVKALRRVRRSGDERLIPLAISLSYWRKRWHQLGRRAKVDTHRRALQAIRRTGASLSKKAGFSAEAYLGHSPKSAGLAELFYIDPEIVDDAPPLPPGLVI